MTPSDYTYISKELESFSSDSPAETHIKVGGYSFNLLVDHPYKEAFSRFGVPAGLVISKHPVSTSTSTTLTREMMHGGSANVPDVISDELYDKLLGSISVSEKPKNRTRKLNSKK